MNNFNKANSIRYLTGLSAAILACIFMYEGINDLPVFIASLFFCLISITDTIYSKIPNLFSFSLASAGFGYNFWASGGTDLLTSSLGLLVGLLLFIIPFLLRGMGAGDVKALAALGAVVGPSAICQVFLYTAMIGGLMSILHYITNRNLAERVSAWRAALFSFLATKDKDSIKPVISGEKLKFPYAAAIAFGYFAFIKWGALI